ncbi:MAG: hypothetical protein ACRDKT_02205 [Actinomycetota bacterium]
MEALPRHTSPVLGSWARAVKSPWLCRMTRRTSNEPLRWLVVRVPEKKRLQLRFSVTCHVCPARF